MEQITRRCLIGWGRGGVNRGWI